MDAKTKYGTKYGEVMNPMPLLAFVSGLLMRGIL
jgi:hypothetical protein